MTNLPPSGEKEKANTFKDTVMKILRRIAHNGGWKIVSLLLAICIWGVLVTQDESLPRTKRFNDVKVNVINTRTLQENGLIVVSNLDAIPLVDVVAQLPQKNYASATADRYQIRADLSQITGTGTQALPLTSSVANSNFYGSVASISPASITVEVERYVTRSWIPVNINLSGSVPEGFHATTATVDPAYVQVAGPESVVNRIARCEVDYDQSMLLPQQGTLRNSLSFHFTDKDGNALDDALLTVSNQGIALRHVIVEQRLSPTLEVPVNTDPQTILMGQPAAGYTVTDILVEPTSVLIADDDLTPYLAEDYTITVSQLANIAGENQTKTFDLALKKTGLNYISNATVSVTVVIAPLEEVE